MLEKESTHYLREWLELAGFLVYTGNEFHITGGFGRPDMTIINEKKRYWNSAIEIKRNRGRDIFLATKIIDYAKDYCNGAKYIIDGNEQRISNFLVATELSEKGRLFDDDVPVSNKRKQKQENHYRKRQHDEPYFEWQRSADFVRSIWQAWKDRSDMKEVSIGILLSSINDRYPERMLNGRFIPKRFVMHYTHTLKKQRWTPWWTDI